MKYQDKIYGKICIKDKVIIELIQAKSLQRLKLISQYGPTQYVIPRYDVTRFEHSVGVWFLSNYFKRPIEEQVASLIHDISHTAFSHVVDQVLDYSGDNYHDEWINDAIYSSEIPDIISRNNINIDIVLQKQMFPLLTNILPDISFDRLDYFLRDGFAGSILSRNTINSFLKNIKIKDNKFYFNDINIAGEFAVLFINACRLIWNERHQLVHIKFWRMY